MRNSFKFAAALLLSLPLLMAGCTCSQQNEPDQVVPMEEPVAPPEEGGAAGALEEEMPAEGEVMEEEHSEDDGHDH